MQQSSSSAQVIKLSMRVLYRRPERLLRKSTLLLIFIVAVCLYFFVNSSVRFESEKAIEDLPRVVVTGSDLDRNSEKRQKSLDRLVSQGCNIPKLSLLDGDISPLLEKPKPLNCWNNGNDNWVWVNKDQRISYLNERRSAKCTIQYIERVSEDENKFEEEIPLTAGQRMERDFASVNCTHGEDKWESLLASISKKESSQKFNKDDLDVVMLGIDSMSQMHFRRKMPKTTKYLEEVMQAVVLNGYNIVGDGTPQALIPILTGKTEKELPNTRRGFHKASFVGDVYPFAWTNFSDKGYMTMYAEDMFSAGTFNYRLKGFNRQPTDHYTRPFYKEMESAGYRKCLGSEPAYKVWFRYAEEFMEVYRAQPKFVFMHQGVYSHDDLNLVEVEDEEMRDSLERMWTDGRLNNAVLIVFADHGARFTKLRSTHQGQLEERLPFFSISLPQSLRNTPKGAEMMSNLEANKDRLTSPFDIHATLMDILNAPASFDEMQTTSSRSLSLFRPIPIDRSCSQAGIDPHWCTCLSWKNAFSTENDRNVSTRVARAVTSVIDSQLVNERAKCARVSLKEVKTAEKLLPNDGVLKYKNVLDADGFKPDLSGSVEASFAFYRLQIVTSPNDAVYEATVFYDQRVDTVELDLTSLSHVSPYGDDPHCIIGTNYFLATFCVCQDRIRH